VFSPGYERVAAAGIQRVDVAAGVVERPVPQMFGELEGDLPLGEGHLFPVPHIHLAAEVKHQHLHRTTTKTVHNGRFTAALIKAIVVGLIRLICQTTRS